MNQERDRVIFTAVLLAATAVVSTSVYAQTASTNAGPPVVPVSIVSPSPLPVSGTLAATQSGAWNVSISNSTTNPLITQDGDSPARHHFLISANSTSGGWGVPPNVIYVIEHYSAECLVDSAGALTSVELTITSSDTTATTFQSDFAVPRYLDQGGAINGRTYNNWGASANTRMYAKPGDHIALSGQANSRATGATFYGCENVSISGYSVPIP